MLHGFTQCSLDFSVLASFSQKVIELFVQILLEGSVLMVRKQVVISTTFLYSGHSIFVR